MKHVLLILMLVGCHNADIADARHQAEKFMQKIPGAQSVLCNDSDSNGDGYVSCTIFRGSADPVAIQCGAENWCAFNCAHGCRLAAIQQGTK
jgi:hypothetical protein